MSNSDPVNDKAKQNKTRLLVLTTTFPRWHKDVEPPFVFELCRRLEDFEVHVVAPHAPDAETEEIMDGIHVHRFRYAPKKLETLAFGGGIAANLKRSPWKYLLLQGFLLGMFFRAFQVAREHKIHLIHAHWMIPTGLIGATLKELLPGDNKLLVTAHGGDVHGLKGRFFQALRRWVAGEADTLSVVSRSLHEVGITEAWEAQHMPVAPMGCDLQNTFFPREKQPRRPTLLYAGRLSPTKGVPHLLEAMKAVVEANPDTSLLIAGDGELEAPLKRQCTDLGLEENVTFLGRYALEALPGLFARSDIAVLPFVVTPDGNADGFGLTTIEAMGSGLPVVVGDVPASREIVEHQKTGLLVQANDPEQLSKAILSLLNDPASARKIAQNGRKTVAEQFDWSACAARYSEILHDLC